MNPQENQQPSEHPIRSTLRVPEMPLDPVGAANHAVDGPDARDPSRVPESRGTKTHNIEAPDEQLTPEAEALAGVERAENEQRLAARNDSGSNL